MKNDNGQDNQKKGFIENLADCIGKAQNRAIDRMEKDRLDEREKRGLPRHRSAGFLDEYV